MRYKIIADYNLVEVKLFLQREYNHFLPASYLEAGVEKVVQFLITKGWKPLGGVTFTKGGLAQAMLLEEETS